MNSFDHEKLDVYQKSIEFLILADQVSESLPRGRAYVADQLRSASLSICLNIAEGGGEFNSSEKKRFYRIARRSATECAAIFDACKALKLVEDENLSSGKALLLRIVSMLVKMTKPS